MDAELQFFVHVPDCERARPVYLRLQVFPAAGMSVRQICCMPDRLRLRMHRNRTDLLDTLADRMELPSEQISPDILLDLSVPYFLKRIH